MSCYHYVGVLLIGTYVRTFLKNQPDIWVDFMVYLQHFQHLLMEKNPRVKKMDCQLTLNYLLSTLYQGNSRYTNVCFVYFLSLFFPVQGSTFTHNFHWFHLQLYFEKITQITVNRSGSSLFKQALMSVATDSGLHPLVPYFIYFISDEVLI